MTDDGIFARIASDVVDVENGTFGGVRDITISIDFAQKSLPFKGTAR